MTSATTPDELFAILEPRVVLSDTYYAWVGVETLPGYAAEYGEPDKLVGASDDGRYLWSSAAADATDEDVPYLVAQRSVHYLRDIPALADAEIAGINSHGVVLAVDRDGDDAGRIFLFDLEGGAGREYLDEAALNAPAEFDLGDATPRFITDAGGLVLTTGADWELRGDQWIVIGPDVLELWHGVVTDVNASNWACGLTGIEPYEGPSVLWRPGAGITQLGDQGVFLNLYIGSESAINNSLTNDGTIFASQSGIGLVLWNDGEITPLEIDGQLDPREFDIKSYSPQGRSGAGALAVIEYWQHDHGDGEQMFVAQPGGRVHVQAVEKQDYKFLTMTESGVLLIERLAESYSEVPGGWFEVVDASHFLATLADEAATVWTEDGTLTVLTRTANGEQMLFMQDAAGVVTYSFAGRMGFDDEPWLREAIAHPATARVLVLSLFRAELEGIDPGDEFDLDHTYLLAEGQIHRAVTGFFDRHGRPVVAGLDENGQILLAYGAPSGDSYHARLANLSAGHLAARALETPDFAGRLDSFRTRWGAMNIVGLDASGDVHAVWWAPGLRSGLWTTSNLSAITGAPKLVGDVTATETPWGGMQIMGADERGHLIALWWSPAVGRWRLTDLTSQLAGPALEPGTLTAQGGPLGGITLVAKSEAGDVVCYWWSRTGGWEAQSLTEEAGGSVPAITGPISYFVAPSGERHVTGPDARGHLIDLYWKPGDENWSWQDLTELAI